MLRCAPDIAWQAESDGIRLVAADRARMLELAYPEAALWDLISRGVAGQRAITMMMHIGGFPDEAAASAFIARLVQEWQGLGLLVEESRSTPPVGKPTGKER
ncbi:MAG: hypothetical protein MI919_33095 [Holophagales bacterium]|nr:hypothetical protein [Holophagales bacterium]